MNYFSECFSNLYCILQKLGILTPQTEEEPPKKTRKIFTIEKTNLDTDSDSENDEWSVINPPQN